MISDPANSASGGARPLARAVLEVPGHKLLRKIGGGAYGDVWLARTDTDEFRAIKIVYRGRFPEERPFVREFEGIKRFEPISRKHIGLVKVLQVVRHESQDLFYYVMELADDAGEPDKIEAYANDGVADRSVPQSRSINPETYEPKTLRTLLRASGDSDRTTEKRHRLSAGRCVEIASDLALALAFIHEHRVVHRDIKPSNIVFIDGKPTLADPGLAAGTGEERSMVGTEGYLAPEGPGHPQADIYGLGKVLYEMMTGLNPNEGSGVALGEKYPSLPDEWATAPDHAELNELLHITMRAADRNPDRRYKTAREMRSDLELLKTGKTLFIRKLQRTAQRWRWLAVGIAMATAVVSLSVGMWVFKDRAAQQGRRSLMREIQISRSRLRDEGWFTNYWARLGGVAAIRKDNEVLSQASALLTGLDARAMTVLKGVEAGSAAFATDGRVLVGGARGGPAILIGTNGAVAHLPIRGEGPVGWSVGGSPLQLIAVTNGLVLRDATSGKVAREFPLDGANPSHSDSDPILALSVDGSLVAAGLRDRLVVWKTETGKLIGETRVVATALAFSPDGSLIGAGTEDGTTRVYELPGLAEIAVLHPALRGSPILCLAFGRDPVVRYGQEGGTNSWLLAVGDQGAGIVIWDLAKRVPRSFCRGSTWIVSAVAFSPDGLTLASAGRNQPRLWDVASGQPLLQLSETSGGASFALAFDRTSRRLLTGGLAEGGNGKTALWELEPHRGILALRGLASAARKVWFSPNSERVAALSDDWHLAVWDVTLNRLLFIFETPVGTFADNAAGCFDAGSNQFAFATGREARLYDLANGRVSRRWSLNDGMSDQLQVDARGRLFLLRREWDSERRKRLWWRLHELGESEMPTLLHEQMDKTGSVEGLALKPGAEWFLILSGGPKGEPRVLHAYDIASGKELWKATTEMDESNFRVRFDPSGQLFGYCGIVPSGTSYLRLTRSSDFGEIGKTPEGYQALGSSGKEFAGDGWLFPDLTGPKHAIPLATDWRGLKWVSAFSASGRLLAWGTEEGVVLVADIPEVRRRLSMLGQ